MQICALLLIRPCCILTPMLSLCMEINHLFVWPTLFFCLNELSYVQTMHWSLFYSDDGDQWDDVTCDVTSWTKTGWVHIYRWAENVTASQFWKQRSHCLYQNENSENDSEMKMKILKYYILTWNIRSGGKKVMSENNLGGNHVRENHQDFGQGVYFSTTMYLGSFHQVGVNWLLINIVVISWEGKKINFNKNQFYCRGKAHTKKRGKHQKNYVKYRITPPQIFFIFLIFLNTKHVGHSTRLGHDLWQCQLLHP